MAARRALEWIGMSKGRLVFRYEISDLFFMYFIPPDPIAAVRLYYTGGAKAQQIIKMVCRVYSLVAQGSGQILCYTRQLLCLSFT